MILIKKREQGHRTWRMSFDSSNILGKWSCLLLSTRTKWENFSTFFFSTKLPTNLLAENFKRSWLTCPLVLHTKYLQKWSSHVLINNFVLYQNWQSSRTRLKPFPKCSLFNFCQEQWKEALLRRHGHIYKMMTPLSRSKVFFNFYFSWRRWCQNETVASLRIIA